MSNIYIVTRHTGTIQWLIRNGIDAKNHLTHIDIENEFFKKGDIVVGMMPIQMVANLNLSGVRYFHICTNLPENMRGKEMTADDMELYGAYLQEFKCKKVSNSIIAPN